MEVNGAGWGWVQGLVIPKNFEAKVRQRFYPRLTIIFDL